VGALALVIAWAATAEEPPARIAVELWSGFRAAPAEEPAAPRVELLVDASASMREPAGPGTPRFVAARRAAERFASALPAETEVALHALVPDAAHSCAARLHTTHAAAGEPRERLLAAIAAIAPGGEASLSAAVDALREALARGGEAAHARVVVVSDLEEACGGDLCQALGALVAAGASADLVVLGEAPTPACLERFDAIGSWRAVAGAEVAPGFRVQAAEPGAEARTLARGAANGPALEVAAGAVEIEVDLEPPLRAGPLSLAPGERARLRILDFPALEPPVREWRVEREAPADGFDRAAPSR
jgi:hypothetical protein